MSQLIIVLEDHTKATQDPKLRIFLTIQIDRSHIVLALIVRVASSNRISINWTFIFISCCFVVRIKRIILFVFL